MAESIEEMESSLLSEEMGDWAKSYAVDEANRSRRAWRILLGQRNANRHGTGLETRLTYRLKPVVYLMSQSCSQVLRT